MQKNIFEHKPIKWPSAHNILETLLKKEMDPTCFKKITIILVPKKNQATCLNNYCLVALKSSIMKCFASKIKEIVIAVKKWRSDHSLVCINGTEMEVVKSFRFLGVQITNNLSWPIHINVAV
eukprot:g44505.t1